MLDLSKAQDRLSRLGNSSHSMVGANAAGVVSYIRSNVAPTNSVLKRLDVDAQEKWATWDVDAGTGRKIPQEHDDCVSLSWALLNELANLKQDAWKIPHAMYLLNNLNDNVTRFMDDWGGFIGDAIAAIATADNPDPNATREKQQKFGILDAPNLLGDDLTKAGGVLGKVVVYFDLDGFKAINTKLTESVVDRAVLPPVLKLIRECISGNGFAYQEGGDEFVLYLPNATLEMGTAISEAVRRRIASLSLDGPGTGVMLTASFGVAHALDDKDIQSVKDRANEAKKYAKEHGKNCVVEWHATGCRIAVTATVNRSDFTKPLKYDNRGIV